MATTVTGTSGTNELSAKAKAAGARANRRFEHLFFSGMALVILAVVLRGFARTYFLAGVFHAPLPNLLIHIHGAVFSSWIFLLIAQTSLVSAGRVDIHRRLGIAGFLLACAMVVLGILTATGALARGVALPGMDAKTFYAVPMLNMLLFATLIFFAFRARFQPAAHKRIILIATIALTPAAFTRWPSAHLNAQVAFLFTYILLLCLVAYDLWSMRRIHRATAWAGAFLIFVAQMSLIIGGAAAWHAFATWAQPLGRIFS
ncbi:MAG TPA: hypothetical protein VN785_09060 [Candidatus Angelobacter sp.]|nr:hypothetical protein [Candidatus Angelobacter sp.]